MENSLKGVLLAAALVFTDTATAYGLGVAASSLKVEIRPLQSTVRNTEELSVNTKIQNISKDDQHLQIWSCSYPEQWYADNYFSVHVERVPCRKNSLMDVRLKPGEVYERALSVRVSVAAEEIQQESVTFRLGFEPSAVANGLFHIWSNPVIVKVTGKPSTAPIER